MVDRTKNVVYSTGMNGFPAKVNHGKAACPGCGIKFQRKRPHAKFCSPRCRAAKWRQENPRMAKKNG